MMIEFVPQKYYIEPDNNPFIVNDSMHEYIAICSSPSKKSIVEKHHIIPQSFLQWETPNEIKNGESNLVNLTPADHFRAHQLLVNFTVGIYQDKMVYALHRMTGSGRYECDPDIYQNMKEMLREIQSKARIGSKNPMWGKSGPLSPTFGRSRTRSEREAITGVKNGAFGKRWITNGTESRRIRREEELPDGFRFGRVMLKKQ